MKIGRLFAVSMLSVTALGLVPAAQNVFGQHRTHVDRSEAIRSVDAFGAVLSDGQHVVGHRAPYITPLFQEAPATEPQLAAIAKIRQLGDTSFEKAKLALSDLSESKSITARPKATLRPAAPIASHPPRLVTVATRPSGGSRTGRT